MYSNLLYYLLLYGSEEYPLEIPDLVNIPSIVVINLPS